uniref:MHD2 domain-containing protein n=1 Tax=Hucho hucho TaxID=62062 RepID=A0A4W5PVA7_9TELE
MVPVCLSVFVCLSSPYNPSLSLFADTCEKTVLKRILKDLWKIVLGSLEKTIILPPSNDGFGAQILTAAKGLSNLKGGGEAKSLTPKQCVIMDAALETIKVNTHSRTHTHTHTEISVYTLMHTYTLNFVL